MSTSFEGFTPKQVEVLELLQGPQRHTCLVGGARSGKTFVLTYATVWRALHHPNSRHAIFRLTANSVFSAFGGRPEPSRFPPCAIT